MTAAKKESEETPADLALKQAQTDLALHQIDFADAQTAYYKAAAQNSQVSLKQAMRSEERQLSNDYNNRRYVFTNDVTKSSVEECLEELGEWHRQTSKCPIELVLMTPGGSVFHGMALFDYLQTLRHEGHYITTVALGYAASMGGILLQAGDKRVMGRESFVLIHEVSAGGIGKVGEMADKVDLMKVMCQRVVNIFVERTGMTAAFINEHWKRTDWWLTSDECLEYGIVDEVR